MKRSQILCILIVTILIAGCNKPYTYTQYGKASNGTIVPYQKEIIRAGSDIDAYKKALITFSSRVISSKQIVSGITDTNELKTLTPFPYCYILLTPNGERVSTRLDANERERVQREVLKSFKDAAARSKITLSKNEILDRDLIK